MSWGCFGAVLGVSWGCLASMRAPRGIILDQRAPNETNFGAVWNLLGTSWSHPWLLWDGLGASGVVLGSLGDLLGAFRVLLEASWESLGGILGSFVEPLGNLLKPSGQH